MSFDRFDALAPVARPPALARQQAQERLEAADCRAEKWIWSRGYPQEELIVYSKVELSS